MRWFAVFLLLSTGAAQGQRISKVDGNRLLQICETRAPARFRPGISPPPGRLECEAYVSGVADAIAAQGPANAAACIPATVTTAQLVAVVVKGLRSHPESTQDPAGRLVMGALGNMFPCKK